MYRTGEVPDGLATVTQLRLQRRRPAPGQTPATTLLYHGNQHTELWIVDQTEEMPALSPGQQAAVDAARRCARCGTPSDQPVPRDVLTGRRVCHPCGEAEARMSWWVWRHQAREAATAWAAGVLCDPDAVLLHERAVGPATWGVYAIAPATGAVLLNAPRVRHNDRGYPAGRPADWDVPGTVGIQDIADQVRALAGRRIVVWTTSLGGCGVWQLTTNMRDVLGENLEQALAVAPRSPTAWTRGTTGDALGDWYADWLSIRRRDGSWRYDRDVKYVDLVPHSGVAPVDVVARMLTLLRCMATDAHPAGLPTCPGLLTGGREVCGRAVQLVNGLCPDCTTSRQWRQMTRDTAVRHG